MDTVFEDLSRFASAPNAERALHFRISRKGHTWHLSEETEGAVGGIFCSLAAALMFARDEAFAIHRPHTSEVLGVLGVLDAASKRDAA